MADISFDDLIPKASPGGGTKFDDLVPPYSGAILPISRDAQGNVSFDSNAGILGALKNAFTLPGDVATGKLPITGQDTTWNPQLIGRTANLAALASPAPPSAATRMIPAVPTAQELKAAGGAGYDAARATGLEFQGDAVANMARDLQAGLDQKGMIAPRVPETSSLIGQLTSPPAGATVTVDGLLAAREAFGKIRQEAGASNTDKTAARSAIDAIDRLLENPDPAAVVAGTAAPGEVAGILRDARGNYAAAQRSNDLTGSLDRANTGISERAQYRAQATNSGLNLDNAIRQRVASLLESPEAIAGFSDAELDALRGVVNGGWARNRARDVGNALGGGGGIGAGVIAGLAGGTMHSPTAGAVVGAALPIAGRLAKLLENSLAKRSLSTADETVRANSPMYQGLLDQAPVNQPAFGRDSAVSRALYGLLAPYL